MGLKMQNLLTTMDFSRVRPSSVMTAMSSNPS